MVTNERVRQLFERLSIPRGMWVAISGEKDYDGKDGRIVSTGTSRSEVLESVSRMPGFAYVGDGSDEIVNVTTVQNA